VLHLSGVRVGALAGDVAKLLALVAHGALVGLGALLGDVSDLAAVVALDALGSAAGGILITRSTCRAAVGVIAGGLSAVAGEVVASAVVALLGLTLTRSLATRRTRGFSAWSGGAFARQVSWLATVVALANVRRTLLSVLLRAITTQVVAGSTDVARLASLGHFLLSS